MNSRLSKSWPIAVLLLAVVGCVESEPGSKSQAIVGGSLSPQDHATLALVGAGDPYCSGVLIEPTLVLTSAHCLPPHVEYSVDEIEVFFGVDLSQGGDRIAVSRVLAHPGWSPDGLANDIGVIELVHASPVEPARFAADLAELVVVGDVVRAVGYGVSQAGGGIDGIKRSGQMSLSAIDESSLYVESEATLTCSGDSGGPLFAESPIGELLIGIHSRSNCETAGLAERVDIHIDSFVSDFIAGIPPVVAICSDPELCNNDLVGSGCSTAPGGDSPWSALFLLIPLLARRRAGRQAMSSPPAAFG